jgi:predicted DCC family thiol-disulfide oxidoreductase YuxK
VSPLSDAPKAVSAPHVVYYNSACPVCDAGVCAMKERTEEGKVEWVDVHTQPDRLIPLGLNLEDVRERLHVTDPSGRLHIGATALVATWSLQSRWGWLLKPMAWPLLRTACDWAYGLFARQLYRWNRRKGHW